MLLRATSFRDRDDVIELDFVIPKVLAAMLARIVVSPNYSYTRGERDAVPSKLSLFVGLGYCFGNKENRTDMAKYITS